MKKEDYINIVTKVRHDTNYDLLPNCFGVNQKLQFKCLKHNLIYEQNVKSHRANRCGCPECKKEMPHNKKPLPQQEVINRIKQVWGDTYDLSKVEYIEARQKITIICKKHGEFKVKLFDLLNLHGCPRCKQKSRLETLLEKQLIKKDMKYIWQFKDDWLKTSKSYYLSLDFYLPKYNVAIECQGKQHFGLGGWTHDEEKQKKNYEATIQRDQRKKQLCRENGIELIYFLEKQYVKYMNEDDIYFTDIDELMCYIMEKQGNDSK